MTTALFDFVQDKFGNSAATYLRNIRKGGDSNKKGATYEAFYAVSKICEIAATESVLDDFIISSQETAFVDDLCVRRMSDRHKTNYQAKNSAGPAADWNSDMADRFRWQHVIDKQVHLFPANLQVLLVSCPLKQAENAEKISAVMRTFCKSEYFPYHSSVTQLVLSCEQLRTHLEKLCDSKDLSIIDAAFRLVLSSWSADDRPTSVKDIIGTAKALARPNIFATSVPESPLIPGWLLGKCSEFTGFDVRQEFSRFIVRYKGFEVSLCSELIEPEPDTLRKLTHHGEFLNFLLSKAHEELQVAYNDLGRHDER